MIETQMYALSIYIKKLRNTSCKYNTKTFIVVAIMIYSGLNNDRVI